MSQVRLSPATVKAMQDLRAGVRDRVPSRFESLQASRALEASTGWDRLRELGERLLDRCRETYASVLAFRREQQEQREQAALVAAARVRTRKPEPRDLDEPAYAYSGPRM